MVDQNYPNQFYMGQPPHVGQKRALPSDFGGEQRTTAPVPPGQRFPGVLPLDLSNIQRFDGIGTGSSDRDLSLERHQNFFVMMPDDLVGAPGDFSSRESYKYFVLSLCLLHVTIADYSFVSMYGDFTSHDPSMAIDSPVEPGRRPFS